MQLSEYEFYQFISTKLWGRSYQSYNNAARIINCADPGCRSPEDIFCLHSAENQQSSVVACQQEPLCCTKEMCGLKQRSAQKCQPPQQSKAGLQLEDWHMRAQTAGEFIMSENSCHYLVYRGVVVSLKDSVCLKLILASKTHIIVCCDPPSCPYQQWRDPFQSKRWGGGQSPLFSFSEKKEAEAKMRPQQQSELDKRRARLEKHKRVVTTLQQSSWRVEMLRPSAGMMWEYLLTQHQERRLEK